MHGNVRKDAADCFDMHFWLYNAWQHYKISILLKNVINF